MGHFLINSDTCLKRGFLSEAFLQQLVTGTATGTKTQGFAEPLSGNYSPLFHVSILSIQFSASLLEAGILHSQFNSTHWSKEFDMLYCNFYWGYILQVIKWVNKDYGITGVPHECPWHNPVRTQTSTLNVKITQKSSTTVHLPPTNSLPLLCMPYTSYSGSWHIAAVNPRATDTSDFTLF